VLLTFVLASERTACGIKQWQFIGAANLTFGVAAHQQYGATHGNGIPIAEDLQTTDLTIDFGTVGAVQVRYNQTSIIFLNLNVKSADAFIVQLNQVTFFASNGHRGGQSAEDSTSIRSLQYTQSYRLSHESRSRLRGFVQKGQPTRPSYLF
jgi:hypothetical protein